MSDHQVSLDLDPQPRLTAAGYREELPDVAKQLLQRMRERPLCGRNVLSGSQGCFCEHSCGDEQR